ncbi:hypothetical protein P4O66_016074, partial [Electrophorus voltai]
MPHCRRIPGVNMEPLPWTEKLRVDPLVMCSSFLPGVVCESGNICPHEASGVMTWGVQWGVLFSGWAADLVKDSLSPPPHGSAKWGKRSWIADTSKE